MSLTDESIPVYTDLAPVYPSLGISEDSHTAHRFHDLISQFTQRFGRPPVYIARAPGRVNLIGAHIDYTLFCVLPFALQQDIIIGCAPRQITPGSQEIQHQPGSVVAENTNPKYLPQVFAPSFVRDVDDSGREGWHLDINKNELRWESYIKAGYYGVLSHYLTQEDAGPVPVDLLVTGSVPPASGVSSSSALVVASTLAFLAVNDKLDNTTGLDTKLFNQGDLVTMTMENERRIGTTGGGMDQATSIMSDSSSALYITFYPALSASPVPLPPRARFIIANSLVVSNKAVTAKYRYNLRVFETLVGARILAKALNVKVRDTVDENGGKKFERVTYREVLERWAGELEGSSSVCDMGVDALIIALDRILTEVHCLLPAGVNESDVTAGKQAGLTMDEMIEMSGLSPKIFHDVYLSWIEVEATSFQIFKRAKHIFSESLRVLQFRKICLSLDSFSPNTSDSNTDLIRLGELMNESHQSSQLLYESSCPELDLLTQLCREAGAFGSRLTGAGWGGCTVSFVADDDIESFILKIQESYPPYRDLGGDKMSEVIFATKPSRGACVYKLSFNTRIGSKKMKYRRD